MDYLFFSKIGGLFRAISASVFFWCKGYSKDIEKPIEDAEGNFLISKVGELEGLESDGVVLVEPEPTPEPEPVSEEPNSEEPTITQ